MIVTVTMNASVDKLYLVDRMDAYTVTRVKEVNNTAGGKGMNVSRVITIAGEDVTATGVIGGFTGRYFMSLVPQAHFTPMFTEVAGELRNCVNVMDLEKNQSTEFLEPGLCITEEDGERFIADYTRAIGNAGVVTISGSLAQGVPTDFYARLIRIAKRQGCKVIFDASGEPLLKGIAEMPTMAKPNLDEIQQLYRADSLVGIDLEQAAVRLHEGGIEIAAISMGSGGLLVACKEGLYRGVPPAVNAVNTVGCGDSIVAGFAIGLARNYSMEHTIRYAMALAAANAMTYYTGSFRPEDHERLVNEVELIQI